MASKNDLKHKHVDEIKISSAVGYESGVNCIIHGLDENRKPIREVWSTYVIDGKRYLKDRINA